MRSFSRRRFCFQSGSFLWYCVRSVDTPLALLPDAPPLEEDVVDSQNWQETVEPHTLLSLSPREIDRQAVIYGNIRLVIRNHKRRVIRNIFYGSIAKSKLNIRETHSTSCCIDSMGFTACYNNLYSKCCAFLKVYISLVQLPLAFCFLFVMKQYGEFPTSH